MASEHSAVLDAKKSMRAQIKKQLQAMSPDDMREQSEAASSWACAVHNDSSSSSTEVARQKSIKNLVLRTLSFTAVLCTGMLSDMRR
jgi:hypothetical protein